MRVDKMFLRSNAELSRAGHDVPGNAATFHGVGLDDVLEGSLLNFSPSWKTKYRSH